MLATPQAHVCMQLRAMYDARMEALQARRDVLSEQQLALAHDAAAQEAVLEEIEACQVGQGQNTGGSGVPATLSERIRGPHGLGAQGWLVRPGASRTGRRLK
jgi:hypothetical protein